MKMQLQSSKKEILTNFLGYLLEDELLKELTEVGTLKNLSADEVILNVGDKLDLIPIVLSGTIKVSRENSEGEELLLYYIEGGDTCAMSLQCCIKNTKSEVRAMCLEESLLLFVPLSSMEKWMGKYKSWRDFVLQSYSMRLNELLEAIDAIAFLRLDERLEKYLIDKAKISGSLELFLTHQEIAEDLHSSRVVVSRLLKQLEVERKVKLYRNKIILRSI
jgi:CRP/FNR family transcriptional regulator